MNAREPIRPLSVEAIEAARITAMSQMRSLIAVLEEQSGLAPGEFIARLGKLFVYPVLMMPALQALEPAFDLLPYTECVQRGVVAGRDAQGGVHFVFSDPFDGAQQSWAEYAFPSWRDNRGRTPINIKQITTE